MNPIKPPHQVEGRLQSIDALRGIAALGVVLLHAMPQVGHAVPNNIFYWPIKGFLFLSSFGFLGVFLFFVISGFCIHLHWAKSRAANKHHPVQFVPFWRRRISRLYPPYLIAFALYLIMAALTAGIDLTHFFVYDVVMHLLMLHNLDPRTCFSINGVFWTLAIEEQLYLAYFLLLYLRKRWGWRPTLVICAMAQVGWFFLGNAIWLATGFAIPVPEGAASHWFSWALGALAVEGALGLVHLPEWCRNLWLGGFAIVLASAILMVLPSIEKDTLLRHIAWMTLHPTWGFGFFVLVNKTVAAERLWITRLRQPRLVTAAAAIGIFSYSLYLTHELVIMQSERLVIHSLPPILNSLLVVVPATIAFAWFFFRFCEKPFMRKPSPMFSANVLVGADEALTSSLARSSLATPDPRL
jgi:peptidoglycan/LPS O-acetylase OafA/YrhL